MKSLFVIRHAKSNWDNPALSDFDRPLNERGMRDAPIIAELFSAEMISIQLIASSPALRAISTASIMARIWGFAESGIQEKPELYHASTSTILRVVNQFSDSVKTAAIFGHNPGLTDFINYTANENLANLPTAGIVQIDFPFNSWPMISAASGSKVYHLFPSQLS